MRVAEISPYSLSIPGGVQGQVVALAHALSNLGHEVDLIAPYDEPFSIENVLSLGRSHSWRANGSIAPIAIGSKMWRRLRGYVESGNYDVVHIHEPFVPFVGVAGMVAGSGLKVGTFHRAGVSTPYRLYGVGLRPLTTRLDISVAVSEEAASTANRVWGLHPQVVGNAVELARFSDATPWPKDSQVVMFIGRHEHRKGLAILLEAVAQLQNQAEFELWIGGDGPQTEELHARYRFLRRVKWLGRISEAEAAARLKASDIVCAPSLYGESFGVVLLEAMASSSAVIASAIPGYQTLVRDRHDALLVEPGDPGALARAISELLSNSPLRAEIVAAGLQTAGRYSIDELAKTYVDVFLEGLSRSGK